MTVRTTYILLAVKLDDNDEQVADPVPLAGTSSAKVAGELLDVFQKRRNRRTTMVHEGAVQIMLPGFLPESQLESLMKEDESPEPEDAAARILSLVG